MFQSDGHGFRLIDDFTAAALGVGSWDQALRGLASVTGSARGQLIGVGGSGSTPFNWVTDLDPRAVREIAAIDGHNPAVNPRVAVALGRGVLDMASEADYDAVYPTLRHDRDYADYVAEYDIPFGCQTTLILDPDMLIGLAVLRTEDDGRTTAEQRAAFAVLAPHVRAAVRTQMLVEGQGAALLAGSLEAVSLAAFVCDRHGLVRAMTPAAEALLAGTTPLSLRDRRLGAIDRPAAVTLDRAVMRAAGPPLALPAAATVVLRDPGGRMSPLVVDVLPLPRREWSLGCEARLLVVPRTPRRIGDAAAVLEAGYRLTGAEATIALSLAAGRSREEIAEGRGVSIGTVRTQIKSIFAKVEVTREVELVARINRLL